MMPRTVALAALLAVLSGCGASALRTHAVGAIGATVTMEAAREAILASADQHLARCGEGPPDARPACFEAAARDARGAASAYDAARLALSAWRDAIEVAAIARDDASSLEWLVQAAMRFAALWRALRASARGVELSDPLIPTDDGRTR